MLVKVCHWSSQLKLGSCCHLPEQDLSIVLQTFVNICTEGAGAEYCFANLAPLLTWDCIPCTLTAICQRSIVLQTQELYSNTLLYIVLCCIFVCYVALSEKLMYSAANLKMKQSNIEEEQNRTSWTRT